MSKTQYTYAVARIRALEVSLFSASAIEQLIACKNSESCLRFLQDKGWGGNDVPMDADAILTREREKIWETIEEMHVDMDVFNVLSYANWFHNLKAAVKEVCTGKSGGKIFFEGTPIIEYLSENGYPEGAQALKESSSAFERWCDNRIIQTIKPQKTNPFSIGPLVAYVIARENEIKTVRIILTCKQNGLSDDSIRERVREMYV